MVHFAGIISLLVLFTALMWFAIGWWVSSIERAKQLRLREDQWNHQLNTLRRDRDVFRDQVEVAHGKIRVLENRRADGTSPPKNEESETSSRARIQRLQGQLDQARQQISVLARRVEEMSEKSVEREDVLEQLKKRLTDTSRTLHDREQKLASFSGRVDSAQRPSRASESDTDYQQVIQQLRIEAQTQSDAAEQDRQRLDHTITEHMQTISVLKAELANYQSDVTDSSGDRSQSDKIESLKQQLDALKRENHEQFEKIEQLSQGSKVVEHQRNRLKTLQSDYEKQQSTLEELERVVAENEPRTEVVSSLKAALEDQENANRKLTRSHAALEEQLDKTKAELSEQRTVNESAGNTVSADEHKALQELLTQHEQAIVQLEQSAHEQMQSHEREVQQLREAMDEQERIVSRLRDVLDRPTSQAPTAAPSPPPVSRVADTPPTSGDLFAVFDDPHSSASPTRSGPSITLYDAPPEKRDNLKKISGIGPAFERALNRLGLYTFEQVSQLTDDDIEWVAQELRSFPERILNGQWVEQAQQLLTDR